MNWLKFLLRRARKEIDGQERIVPLDAWIEQVATTDIEKTKSVLQLAKRVYDNAKDSYSGPLLRRAKIVPAAQGQLVSAADAVIADSVVPEGMFAVHPDIAADKQCRQVLEQVLGVQPLDDKQWRSLLEDSLRAAENAGNVNDAAWQKFWTKLRSVPDDVALEFVTSSTSRIRVRSARGQWEIPAQVLRPGLTIPDHPDLAGILLDRNYHENDGPLLAPLNIGTEPRANLI